MAQSIHCQQDGWGWIGTCPHCHPGCPCGRYCNGPYLAGQDDQGQPVYSDTPVVLDVTGPGDDDGYDDPDELLENRTSEDGYIMWN